MKYTPRRHISFDFWNTLASPNPTYDTERAELLARAFNTTADTAKTVYAQLKQCADGFALTGQQPPAPIIWDSLAMAMAQTTGKETHHVDMQPVRAQLEGLFCRYPPSISPATCALLMNLYREGYGLSIGSNTSFISGSVLRDIVRHYKLDKLFSFMLFSDEVGITKPNPGFFHMILEGSGCRNVNQVVHIGDSVEFDIQGANNFGMRAVKVSSPEWLVEHIMGKIENDKP